MGHQSSLRQKGAEMKSNNINFVVQLNHILLEGIADINKQTVKIANKHAKHLKEQIINDSPERSGDYKKNWKTKNGKTNGLTIDDAIVYNANPTYRLTHLLENGHIAANGKRVGKIPHIKDNAEREIQEYVGEVKTTFGGE